MREAEKKNLTAATAGVYLVIFTFYMGLCWTAALAFDNNCPPPAPGGVSNTTEKCLIKKVYTTSFNWVSVSAVRYIVTVLPLVSVTTNYPILAVTLRNNMALGLVSVAVAY